MKMIGKELKVKHTNSYSKFAILPMNRGIDSKHVQKMITSIRKMGVLRCVIACTTNIMEGEWKTYIIDGQHLAMALEREEQLLPYVEITVDSEEDLIEKMAYLNNSSKSWDMMNYINAWKMIRPDYMKLFKWKNMYDIEIVMLAAIGINNPGVRYGTGIIKTGDFQITNPKAEDMCKAFNDIFLKIGKSDRAVKFQFLNAFMQAYNPKYDHNKIMAAIEKHLKTVKLMAIGDETGAFIRKQIFKLPK
jgi:flavodoxin